MQHLLDFLGEWESPVTLVHLPQTGLRACVQEDGVFSSGAGGEASQSFQLKPVCMWVSDLNDVGPLRMG